MTPAAVRLEALVELNGCLVIVLWGGEQLPPGNHLGMLTSGATHPPYLQEHVRAYLVVVDRNPVEPMPLGLGGVHLHEPREVVLVLLIDRIMDFTGRVGDSTMSCASPVACLSSDVAFPCQEPTFAVREQDRSLLVVVLGLVHVGIMVVHRLLGRRRACASTHTWRRRRHRLVVTVVSSQPPLSSGN